VNLFSSTMSLAFFVGDSQEQVVGDVAPRTASDYLLVGKGSKLLITLCLDRGRLLILLLQILPLQWSTRPLPTSCLLLVG
jgi:hypothetical protein